MTALQMNSAMVAGYRNQVIYRESTGRKLIEQSRIRVFCVMAFFLCCFMAIGCELIKIAIHHHSEMEDSQAVAPSIFFDNQAQNEEFPTKPVIIARNDIVDRNGIVLATTLATESLFANPRDISNPSVAAKRLAHLFPDLNEYDILKKLKRDATFVWIKRNLTPKEQMAANNLGIPGLYFQSEHKRVYPHRNLLSHIIGFVGLDNKGLAGIEKYFDKQLRNLENSHEPLQLSIDMRLQNIVAEEIKQGMDTFNAIGATGIVLDIGKGEILAMANAPDFDPHHPKGRDDMGMFNRASLGSYEMGSTFKTFTTAMALDYGVANLNDGYDASRPIQFANYTIKDEHAKNRWLSIPEIYTYSSNIGTVRMIMDVGREKQQAFLRKMGLMQPVDVELPELGAARYPSDWTQLSSMTIAYGHGMAVTPLHLVRGIASIVNGGMFERISLVKDGNANKPRERVISEKTSLQMRRLMRMVVEYGTGKKADVAGYRVGGKTGTAEKVTAGGGYSHKANMAVFVSAFPIDNPKYLVLIMLDEAKGNKSTYGFATAGWVAAPVAGNIISRMAPMYGLEPRFDIPEDPVNNYWVNNASQRFIHAISYKN